MNKTTDREKKLLILLHSAKAHAMEFDPPVATFNNLAQRIQHEGVEITKRQISNWINQKKIPQRIYKGRTSEEILYILEKIITNSPLGKEILKKD
jgi:hypothetical protein